MNACYGLRIQHLATHSVIRSGKNRPSLIRHALSLALARVGAYDPITVFHLRILRNSQGSDAGAGPSGKPSYAGANRGIRAYLVSEKRLV